MFQLTFYQHILIICNVATYIFSTHQTTQTFPDFNVDEKSSGFTCLSAKTITSKSANIPKHMPVNTQHMQQCLTRAPPRYPMKGVSFLAMQPALTSRAIQLYFFIATI